MNSNPPMCIWVAYRCSINNARLIFSYTHDSENLKEVMWQELDDEN